ncbi:MAG: hypothetical protein AAGJ83_09925, partial [Planctomycetota bacterium]
MRQLLTGCLLIGVIVQGPKLPAQITLPDTNALDPAPGTQASPIVASDSLIATEVTPEILAEKRAAVDADAELSDGQRKTLQEQLDQAASSLEKTKTYRAAKERSEALVSTAPQRQSEIDRELELAKQPPTEIDPSLNPTELNAELAGVSTRLNEEENRVESLTAEPTRRRTRLTEIAETLAKIEPELAELKPQLNAVPDADVSTLEREITALAKNARAAELGALADSLRSEQSSFTATADLIVAERKLSESRVKALRDKTKRLQEAIAARQREKVEETAADLRQTIENVPTGLKPLAERNIELAETQRTLNNEIESTNRQSEKLKETRQEIDSNLSISKERVDKVGLTEVMRNTLRSRRSEAEEIASEFRPKTDVSDKIQEY